MRRILTGARRVAGFPMLHFSAGQTFEIVEVREHNGAWYATNTQYSTLWFPLSSTDWKNPVDGKGAGQPQCAEDAQLASLSYVPAGSGRMVYKDSSRYEGEWVDGQRHGKGSFSWPESFESHPCYNGEWSKGQMCGQGVLEWRGGVRFVGTFHSNCPVKGVLEEPGPTSSCVSFTCKGAVECPQGHAMKMQESMSHWTCDLCDKIKTGRRRMRCAECDYGAVDARCRVAV